MKILGAAPSKSGNYAVAIEDEHGYIFAVVIEKDETAKTMLITRSMDLFQTEEELRDSVKATMAERWKKLNK